MAFITPDPVDPGDVLSASVWNQDVVENTVSLPRGVVGYAQVTAAQNGIGTAITDLTSLSVTFTALAGRRYRITGFAQWIYASGSPAVGVLRITDGANIQISESNMPGSAAVFTTWHVQAVVTPSAGSVTYKLRANVNSGTINVTASSTAPVFIMVEDLGAA